MTAPTIDTAEGVDNYDWLQAIDDDPELTTTDLLGAYAILGVRTDLTPMQVNVATFRLQLRGFLEVVDISADDDGGRTYTYELRIPGTS